MARTKFACVLIASLTTVLLLQNRSSTGLKICTICLVLYTSDQILYPVFGYCTKVCRTGMREQKTSSSLCGARQYKIFTRLPAEPVKVLRNGFHTAARSRRWWRWDCLSSASGCGRGEREKGHQATVMKKRRIQSSKIVGTCSCRTKSTKPVTTTMKMNNVQ